jgi:hypothetical protein
MEEELQRLRECLELGVLLRQYAEMGETDREAWQDRLMQMDGVEPKQLVQLHGELIAYGWIDQNTGVVSPGPPGSVAKCYRVTAAGRRTLRLAQVSPNIDIEELERTDQEAAAKTDGEKKPRRKRSVKLAEVVETASEPVPDQGPDPSDEAAA